MKELAELLQSCAAWEIPPPPARYASARVWENSFMIGQDGTRHLQLVILDALSHRFFYWWSSRAGWMDEPVAPIGAHQWTDAIPAST